MSQLDTKELFAGRNLRAFVIAELDDLIAPGDVKLHPFIKSFEEAADDPITVRLLLAHSGSSSHR